MDFSTQTLTDDTKSMSDLFELVEKQRIQLNEKDKELATKEQQIKELSSNLNLVTTRANEADELEAALATSESEKNVYQQTIQAYQTQFWKYFPSSHPCYYYIKTTSGPQQKCHYLFAESSGRLRSSGDQPIPCAGYFKFTKNSDGSFFIYSMVKEKYLQINPYARETHVNFSANDCSSICTKFVLTFLPQNKHPGSMVDIRSLANDNFLSEFYGFVMANSGTSPPNKFLILPVVDGQ